MHVISLNDIGRKKGANQTKDVLSSLLVLYCCQPVQEQGGQQDRSRL